MVYSGVSIFFKDAEETLFRNVGRELLENIILQHFTLYRIDVSNTESNFYGESKKKNYLSPIEVIGRVRIADVEALLEGGVRRVSKGDMIAHVFLKFMEENDFEMNVGDFIGYQGKFYEIYDAGYNLDEVKLKYAGDRDFYRRIIAKVVKDDVFSGST